MTGETVSPPFFALILAGAPHRPCLLISITIQMAILKDSAEDLLLDLEDLNRNLFEDEEDEQSYGCLICGNHPFFVGHSEKSNPNRLLRYWLCRECYEKPESESIVKKIIDYYETTRRFNPNLLDQSGTC